MDQVPASVAVVAGLAGVAVMISAAARTARTMLW